MSITHYINHCRNSDFISCKIQVKIRFWEIWVHWVFMHHILKQFGFQNFNWISLNLIAHCSKSSSISHSKFTIYWRNKVQCINWSFTELYYKSSFIFRHKFLFHLQSKLDTKKSYLFLHESLHFVFWCHHCASINILLR